jgi:rhamnose transport system permease protein
MSRRREASIAVAIAALYGVLLLLAPGFFSRGNLNDLFLGNFPVLLAAMGATLVVLAGEIDISIGSMFAVCGVCAASCAVAGVPLPVNLLITCAAGALLGAINGALVAYAGLPSIVVTLAAMVAWRDGLRWVTQGAWVQGLPASFQWLGLSQQAFPVVAAGVTIALQVGVSWASRHVSAFRAVYATGSDAEAARLAGIAPARVKCLVFTAGGAFMGLAAFLNAVRFNQVPSNAGLGLEMKVIAAVVVGGTAIGGGRGSFGGTLLGVILLASVGPALVFLGVNSYWERALHGVIILLAVTLDALARGQGAGGRAVGLGKGLGAPGLGSRGLAS